MAVERTKDTEWIASIITDPRVWRWVSEDGDECGAYRTSLGNVVYLKTSEHGFLSFRPFTKTAWEVHVCMVRGAVDVVGQANAALDWMRAGGVKKFVARIPAMNRHAIRLAEAVGFTRCGVIRGCIVRGGVARDLVLMES